MSKKTDYASLRQGFGLVHGLSTEFMRMCERHNVPIEAIHRLVTPDGERTMEAIIGRINADWQRAQAKESQPKDGLYKVHVGYDMPRDKEKLEKEFGVHGVGEMFYGSAEWQLDPSCIDIDQSPGERIMLVKHFGAMMIVDAIAEMDKLGCRPATHLEAYAFAKANPEVPQYDYEIIALGSFVVDEFGDILAPVLRGGPKLHTNGHHPTVGPVDRLLLVRK